jgi:hypothetical protein
MPINEWKPWNGEKLNCIAGPRCGKKHGRLCHPKMGGEFQNGIECWFPQDEEVEVDYD